MSRDSDLYFQQLPVGQMQNLAAFRVIHWIC